MKIGNLNTEDINMDNATLNKKYNFLYDVMYQYLEQKGIHVDVGDSFMGLDSDNIDGSIVQEILISRVDPAKNRIATPYCTYVDKIFYIGLNEKGNGYLEESNEVEFAEFELKKDIIEKILGDLLTKMKF
ncbi:Hypothetical protein HVR_LOCUS897 [uncultured virus]|nr:Hypothetical protein HVR_LOCUS897 [uncultured virus]